jgi:polyisoprenoid-binding protein YceI
MKKIIITIICITCLSTISQAQEKLDIDISKSSIKWFGEYTFYFGGHEGNIHFKEGYFIKANEKITGGEFIIDMNSITNLDIKGKIERENLVDHLKKPDFFDVKKYPIAKLTITKIEYFEDQSIGIIANLTLKGTTKPIKFNATLNYQEKSLTTKFKIDRRKWNVNYKSKFKDGAISDAITFEISIKLLL